MKMTISVLFVALALGATSAQAAMTLTSPDIKNGGAIPSANVHSKCGGQNVSPQLVWSGAPATTQSFVVTVIDLDVKPDQFSHWIIVDLPPNTGTLPRGAAGLPLPAKAVANNFGETAYGGPCPPKGSGKHRYQFTIWALPSATTSIAPNEKARVVNDTLTKIAVDKASLTATYGR
jgi:Raf kinase inhibitor-like YbhB/YbcL family protein